NKVAHLVYASSSSVYGANKNVPYSVKDNVDNPISFYAATKKSNELMAHTYSHLYDIQTTGLRFFTVYGPWGRPDMAAFLFTKAILDSEPIKVFNEGNMSRDFTYIDDVVEGVSKVLNQKKEGKAKDSFKIYNVGNNSPTQLLDFISAIENALGKTAEKQLMPMQEGDMQTTYADITTLKNDFNYQPQTSLNTGIQAFVDWYQGYYSK
ncbi:MAG: UDP-glucuronate 4-epimerase, partial [Saprospiraceae bacterium]